MRSNLETFFLRVWSGRGVIACLLWPVAKIFQLIISFRSVLFVLGLKSQTKLDVPIVVVGNIFLGGTGKTPLVIWLVQQLKLAGWRPGVISRGYAADAATITEVHSDSSASEVGDEPLLIVLRTDCPVMVGRNRVAAASALLLAHPSINIIISDDGLQHYALARDVEILMFDQRGVGNGWLLPAGPLRETAQRRRDFTILNAPAEISVAGIGYDAVHMQLMPDKIFCLSAPEQVMTLTEIKEKRITAAAGIGHPERFFAMLRRAGLNFASLPLNDHHVFSAKSFCDIDADIILITEKDAVKCRQIAELRNDVRIWVAPVSAQLAPDLLANILKLISEKQNGRTLA
ncbi:MAG: tetraacyldisaccharide 4'-kinase [Pseudomonadota bacterium]